MSRMDPLLFGGLDAQAASPDETRPPQPFGAFNAQDFNTKMLRWLATVYANYASVPGAPQDLEAFDRYRLASEFRADYEAGRVDTDRGTTIEEQYLGFQFGLAVPAIALVNEQHASEPLGRIARKEFMPAAMLSHEVEAHISSSGGTALTLVHDGHFGHSITVNGADPSQHLLRFEDPWRGGSLLAEGRNSAGIAATRDPSSPNAWQVETSELAKVLVAAVIPLPLWNRTHVAREFLAEPFMMRYATAATFVLDQRIAFISENPGSRAAVGSAALALAAVLEERGQFTEAAHWLSQAALMGQTAAMHLLADPRKPWSQDPAEVDYWARQSRAIAATTSPWALDPNDIPGSPTQMYQNLPEMPTALSSANQLAAAGRIREATVAFESVFATDNMLASDAAHYDFARVLAGTGHIQEAEAHFLVAARASDPYLAAYAAYALGQVCEAQEKDALAAAAYERAIYAHNPDVSPAAATNLRGLLSRSGDSTSAKPGLFRRLSRRKARRQP